MIEDVASAGSCRQSSEPSESDGEASDFSIRLWASLIELLLDAQASESKQD